MTNVHLLIITAIVCGFYQSYPTGNIIQTQLFDKN